MPPPGPPGSMYSQGAPPPLPQNGQYQNTAGYQNSVNGGLPYPPPAAVQGGGQQSTRWGAAPRNASMAGGGGASVTTLGQKRPREEEEDSVVGKIFFGGLHADTVESELKEYFSQFGELSSFYIVKDRVTGRHKGYGFGVFSDPSSVAKVLAQQHFSHGKRTKKQAVKCWRSATDPDAERILLAWARGACSNGDACMYSHDAPQGTSISSLGPKKPCFNYRKGICTFGDKSGTPMRDYISGRYW